MRRTQINQILLSHAIELPTKPLEVIEVALEVAVCLIIILFIIMILFIIVSLTLLDKNNGGKSFILEAGGFYNVPINHKHDNGIPISEPCNDDELEFTRPSKIPLLVRMPSSNLISTEIDVNETIKKLKEEIHDIEGVPLDRLILRINELELNDQKSIKDYDFSHNSEVVVSVAPIPVKCPPPLPGVVAEKHTIKAAEEFPHSRKIILLLHMPLPKIVAIEMDVNDTIKNLKEKLYGTEGVHPTRLILHANGIELNDSKSVKDCELSDNSNVFVSIQAVPITAAPQPTAELTVVFDYDGKQTAMEVNLLDTVGELKNKLQNTELNIPQDCFFIHNQAVMCDDRSLRWHRVTHGDTIDIFMGYVA